MDTVQHRWRWPNIWQTLGRCQLIIVASSIRQYQTSCNFQPTQTICIPFVQRPPNVVQKLCKCFVFTGLNAAQQTQGVEPVLVWCRASVAAGAPALNQHWVNIVLVRSVDKCSVPKQKNKFRLIHGLYCPQEPFNNINYKSHWHYIY